MAEENVIKLDENLESVLDAANAENQADSTPESTPQAQENHAPTANADSKDGISYYLNAIKNDKKMLIGVAVIGFLFVLLLIFIVIVALNKGKSPKVVESEPLNKEILYQPDPILSGIVRPNIDNMELGNMIKKANLLYFQGNKLEALDLFDDISAYSSAIANYNLGVIKLKEGDYKGAIKSFDSVLNNAQNAQEDISSSAFDAAYSAYMLGDMNLYNYYVGISSSYLFHSINQPIYSYLYGMLQYYQGQYFEALSPFLNPNSSSYNAQNHKMAAEIYLVFGDDYSALSQLKQSIDKSQDKQDMLAAGLLHARLGEYQQAKQYIYEYLGAYPKDPDALMSLQLIELKKGDFKESALLLNQLNEQEETQKIFASYPIKAKLKDEIFDVNLAQENFWNRQFEHSNILGYKILFYYAPFRVFDPKGAINVIQDGNLNVHSHNFEGAKTTLQEGQKVSQINQNIAQDLRNLILNQDIRTTIKSMEKSLKIYPNHSILHYNMGLLYAQMNDFDNAYNHFIRAYHLDGNDIMSAIFAMMCGELTYRDTKRLSNSISSDFAEIDFSDELEREFLLSLFRYGSDNVSDGLNYLDKLKDYKIVDRKPLYYALGAVYSIALKDQAQIMQNFEQIRKISNQDIVANTMLELAKHYNQNLKDVALEMNAVYKEKKLDMRSIYYGPSLARELYVYIGFVTGSLKHIQDELESKLIVEQQNVNGIMQALALSCIYSNEFEKSFALYNTLLDDIKEDDYHTRFLAAIAAMGAGRHENAVALLQLSKIESERNFEARYALGLLYQEANNIKAAISHYDQISSVGFVSEFFDFEIDTSDMITPDPI